MSLGGLVIFCGRRNVEKSYLQPATTQKMMKKMLRREIKREN